jgi:predicted nucleic acid-binding protein
MNQLFADTSFFVAFLNPRDDSHDLARKNMADFDGALVTTVWVIAELRNYLSKRKNRKLFVPFVRDLQDDSRVTISGLETSYFERGLARFAYRPDKEWSFTDCVSFVVMEEGGIADALTTDHHFEQAGFKALMR